MGPIILIAVLLHAFSSYWQLSRQPQGRTHCRIVDTSMIVRVAIILKELVILPAIVLILVWYSFDVSAQLLLTIKSIVSIWSQTVGLLLVAISILLKIHAYLVLGKNWSAKPTIHTDHSLVREGPYAWVRHPVYTSNIIMLLGAFFATSSLTLLMLGICYFITDVIRANEEERKLVSTFTAYPQYASRVGKYVPNVVIFSVIGIVIMFNCIGIVDELLFTLTGCSFTVSWIVSVFFSI